MKALLGEYPLFYTHTFVKNGNTSIHGIYNSVSYIESKSIVLMKIIDCIEERLTTKSLLSAKMSIIPTFQTKRLILRNWRESDLLPFSTLNGTPEVMEYMPGILTKPESDALAFKIKNSLERLSFGLWAVEVKTDGNFIGFVGLSRPTFDAHFTPCIEIGWRISLEHWGKGYATEAALKATELGFEKFGLNEIVSFTAPNNQRSRRVMEKLGMLHNPIEDFNHPKLPNGHPLKPHVLYRLKKTVWNSLQ